jgi:Protein of unknown function (DUF3096).
LLQGPTVQPDASLQVHDKLTPIAYARAVHPRIGQLGQAHGEIADASPQSGIHSPLVALIAGILILLMPRLLNYVVAIYLIVIGIIGLSHHFQGVPT